MRRVVVTLVITVLACGVLGCGDSESGRTVDSAPVELEPIGEAGVDQSPYPATYGSATGSGSDLVVIESGPGVLKRRATALRRPDGSWWQLPDLPFAGYVQLASAGDRAVAGGIACTDSGCTEGELAFAMLSEDRSEWIRLEAPDVALSPTETELTTGPGLSEFADFAVGSGYRVDAEGEVSERVAAPRPLPGATMFSETGPAEVGCAVGDTYISMLAAFPDPENVSFTSQRVLIGDVYSQPLDGSEQPTSLGPVPADTVLSFGAVCASGVLSVQGPDSAAHFDVADRSWRTTPSNLPELTFWVSPISGRLATAADGSVAIRADPSGNVVRRRTDLTWDDTGIKGHVFATSDTILVIGDDLSITSLDQG